MKTLSCLIVVLFAALSPAAARLKPATGLASWYGEEHRGKLMADGKPFDPDKLTAASWEYPLGIKVRVTLLSPKPGRSVVVTITDRGPSRELVRAGRIIDLSRAAFQKLAHTRQGLIHARVEIAAP